jgi:hypothetical protein
MCVCKSRWQLAGLCLAVNAVTRVYSTVRTQQPADINIQSITPVKPQLVFNNANPRCINLQSVLCFYSIINDAQKCKNSLVSHLNCQLIHLFY